MTKKQATCADWECCAPTPRQGYRFGCSIFLGFEIKSLNPVTIDGLDIDALNLRRQGNYSYRPYFTTFKELK